MISLRPLVLAVAGGAALACALLAGAHAQISLGVGTQVTTFRGPQGPIVPTTPCTAGQIDLSLTTGCNIPFFIGGIFP